MKSVYFEQFNPERLEGLLIEKLSPNNTALSIVLYPEYCGSESQYEDKEEAPTPVILTVAEPPCVQFAGVVVVAKFI